MGIIEYIINNIDPFYGIISIAGATLVIILFGLSSTPGLKKLAITVSAAGIGLAAFFFIYSFLTKGIFSTAIIAFDALHVTEIIIILFISLNMLILLSMSKIKEDHFIKMVIVFMFSIASFLFLVLSRNFLAVFIALALFILANFQLVSGMQSKVNPAYTIKFFLNSSLALLFLFLGFSFMYAATDFKNLQQIMESGALENAFYPISLVFIAASVFLYMFLYPMHGNFLKLAKHSENPVLPFVLFYFLPAGLILILKFRTIIFHFLAQGSSSLAGVVLGFAGLSVLGPAIGALSTTSLKRVMGFAFLSFMGLVPLAFSLIPGEMLKMNDLMWIILFSLINLVVCFMPVWLITARLKDAIGSLKGLVYTNQYVGINLIIALLGWMGMLGTSGFLLRYNMMKPFYQYIIEGRLWTLNPVHIVGLFVLVLSFLLIMAIAVKLIVVVVSRPVNPAAKPFFGLAYRGYITVFTIILVALGILGLFQIFGLPIFPGFDLTRLDFLALPS